MGVFRLYPKIPNQSGKTGQSTSDKNNIATKKIVISTSIMLVKIKASKFDYINVRPMRLADVRIALNSCEFLTLEASFTALLTITCK